MPNSETQRIWREMLETCARHGFSDKGAMNLIGCKQSVLSFWKRTLGIRWQTRGRPSGRLKEIDARMVELRESGWTLAEIAAKYGVTRQRIHQLFHSHGLAKESKERCWQTLRDCQTAEMEPLYRQGLLDVDIAERVGYAATTVGRWRKQQGLPKNPAPRKDKKLTPPVVAECRRMLRAGITGAAIAKAVGVSPMTISRWRRREGLGARRNERSSQ